jgi:hypothetical protein
VFHKLYAAHLSKRRICRLQAFSLLICQDPRAAGNQLRDAVQAGGQQAQTAVYSLLNADCPDDSASSQAYSAAIDSVNSGDPADLQAVSR